MSKVMSFFACGATLFLAACGQKGPLYLPDSNPTVVTRPTQSSSQTPAKPSTPSSAQPAPAQPAGQSSTQSQTPSTQKTPSQTGTQTPVPPTEQPPVQDDGDQDDSKQPR